MSEQYLPPVAPSAPEKRVPGWLVAASYVLAVLIPFVGFILGIVLIAFRRFGHGLAVVVISIVVFWAAVGLILSSDSGSSNSSLPTPLSSSAISDPGSDMSAADVVDAMPSDLVSGLCDANDVGSESMNRDAFVSSYEEAAPSGSPSGDAIWSEILSRC